MAWRIEGQYFENCTCEVPCPCTASLTLGADYDRCNAALAFDVQSGEVDGVDVSGLGVVAVADTPKYMHEGNWRLGVFVDDRASDEQAEKLAAVFSGQVGGPMEALAPLIGESLGMQRVPLEFRSEDGHHAVRIGDVGMLDVQDVVPFGKENGEPVRLTGVFHPAASELTIAKGGDSRLNAFGLQPELAGKSGFSARFAWSG